MTDRELKKQLKAAYRLPASDTRNRFVRKHERRSLQFVCILRIEMQHMGLRSALAGGIVFLLLYAGCRAGSPEVSWALSCLIPAAAVTPVAAMGRSERYGMAELEAASRFSCPFVHLVRLLILGAFSIAVLPAACIRQASALHTDAHGILLAVAVPYLLNIYGGLAMTRKWHGRESVYAVIAAGTATSLLPVLLHRMQQSGEVSAGTVLCILAVVVLGIIRECGTYVKESGEKAWNLC